MMMDKILIIIVNYLNYTLTINCVRKLRKSKLYQDILIVDNQSPNESYKELISSLSVMEDVYIIQSGRNSGYSYGNNCGFRWAENKGYNYFCIMNPDIVIKDSDYFNKLIAVMNSDVSIAAVSGVQIYAGHIFGRFLNYWNLPGKLSGITDHSFVGLFRTSTAPPLAVKDNYAYVDVLSGCCFLIRADSIKKAEYFDERIFLFYEENILSSKLRSLGLREALCFNTFFYHNHETGNAKVGEKILEKKIQATSRRYFYRNYVTKNSFLNMIQLIFSAMDICVSFFIYCIYGVIKSVHTKKKV